MHFRSSDLYQIVLIALGITATAFFSVFVYREAFPEYKIYQKDYVELEKFRSEFTHEPPPDFQYGIKQIVLEREDKGPALVDRCISCHVALQISDFSPLALEKDEEGKIAKDADGNPVQIENKNYIWKKLEDRIAELTDEAVIKNLKETGRGAEAEDRIRQADKYRALKVAHVGEHTYDVTKVLRAHPLIGKETRPFEFHPISEYACTSCHNGNGQGLTTDKAHGPVFDGQYEEEYMGPEPQFLEKDENNDPAFSKVFNHKPGPSLIFQTNPIFVGPLIQAKCAACHTSSQPIMEGGTSVISDMASVGENSQEAIQNQKMASSVSGIDALMQNYHRGQQLFISQACYACHRIAGFSRGGVGPDLTKEGLNYPWFIKESIVWPQADLKTSTMPNYRLDHEELQDLVTFLLGQTGPSKLVSDTAYKLMIKEWDEKKKMAWEKPVTPAEVIDLKYAMTVFATEGCSACHRLKGFESNVGFAVEKEGNPSFDALESEREWFRNTIPEEISPAALVEALEKNAGEIDKRIDGHVRKNSLLEEVDRIVPGQVESLNTPFQFAKRAKNDYFKQKIEGEKDDQKKKKWKAEWEAWQERVHNTLMMYVQEYGLGRLVGPRPNWSGIFRTDEWLMEHFKKPTAHVPRSIMPVFPFDETKFLSLTHMLDVLAKKNRDEIREVWDREGFNPEMAYNMFCSQCHGDFRQGNGPVAAWIYPIPKNLKNADFLRNLTKERVVYSITHGVKGTPMPPWGEVAEDKKEVKTPVMNKEEINLLADWLFSSLPGGTIFKNPAEVPKWQYGPQEILKELYHERDMLQPGPSQNPGEDSGQQETPEPKLGAISHPGVLLAAINPFSAPRKKPAKEMNVEEVFDIYPNPAGGPDEHLYYIKSKYYTKENLEAGRAFFELNCAVCHGKEGDGQGNRAEAMQDAKPRMLINVDWGESRDDLRLLRSIKFGVPGTSMTPWGDLTSALQRFQLVMYIRSLSTTPRIRESILASIYKAFETSKTAVEKARAAEYPVLSELQSQYNQMKGEREKLYGEIGPENLPSKESAEAYEKELNLLYKLKQREELDNILKNLKKKIGEESDIYQRIGFQLLGAKGLPEKDIELYLQILQANASFIQYQNGELSVSKNPELEQKIASLSTQLLNAIEKRIQELQKQKPVLEGKMPTQETKDRLTSLANEEKNLRQLHDSMTAGFQEAAKLRESQVTIYQEFTQKKKELDK